ncbi:unnamed protein product [Leptosia nina]|uniref:RNase H type-1 domain-containing protein n=1 Tax=Leptosia nina TaxID=320188 RepID=A0AAV1J2K1_9NEOP
MRRLDKELKTVKIKLATYCTVFQAEMVALHKAVQLATKVASPKVNLCSDSRSALDDIVSGRSLSPLVVQIRETLGSLSNHKEVRLYWIKAHVGHEGNERADQLAKEAAHDKKRKPDYDRCPVSKIKRLLRTDSIRRWEEEYGGGTTASTTRFFLPTVASALKAMRELIEIFSAGLAGFDSVKFTSNSTEVLKNIPVAHRMSELVEFSSDSQLKILGLHWSPSEDSFVFSVNVEQRKCTKRNILSTIARLWDVMGFVAPLKSLWKNNIDWDEKPPSNISSLWQQFEAELPLLKNLKMSRHV